MALRRLHPKALTFYTPDTSTELSLPYFPNGVKAGFPSPAADHMGEQIDLNRVLIKNPQETFYIKVDGDSMTNAGIGHGDILVVDRSEPTLNGKIYVCTIDGEFTVKRVKIDKKKRMVWLVPENENYEPIEVTPENESFLIWGRVIHVIKDV
jgi:DNA polymerase V